MATEDILTVDRARQILSIGVGDSSKRDMLESAITAVSQRIDKLCGPVVRRTVTEVVDTCGEWSIALRWRPVHSVTTVTEYEAGAGTVVTAESLTVAGGYLAEQLRTVATSAPQLSGVLRRRNGFTDDRWPAPGRVQVVYVAGRYENTASCADTIFEQAALATLNSWWRMYLQRVDATPGEYATPYASFPTFAVPQSVLDLLADERIHLMGVA